MYNADNVKLATVESGQTYTDPAGLYPNVAVISSQPMFCDATGDLLDQSEIPSSIAAKLVVDGKVYFMHEYYQKVFIGARTYAKLPSYKDTTTYLSPLDGYTHVRYTDVFHSEFARETFTITKFPVLKGALAMQIDTGTAPWGFYVAPGAGTIKCNLEPIDYQLNTWNPAPRTGYTLNDALAKLQNNYGNRRVNVVPSINMQGLSDLINYEYKLNSTLLNGTQVMIDATMSSGNVGFTDAYRDTSDEWKGAVPNALPTDLALQMPVDGISAEAKKNVAESETPLTFIKETTIRGWVDYGDSDRTLTVGAHASVGGAVSSSLPGIITISPGSIDTATFPNTITVNQAFGLQPRTDIKIATMQIGWTVWFWDGAIPDLEDVKIPMIQTIECPYALTITNSYTMTSVVVKTAVITECDINMVTANGEPIDPASITDYELTTLMNNPIGDIITTQLTKENFDIITFLNTIGTIVIIFVIILVIFLFFFILSKVGGGIHSIIKLFRKIR